MSTSLAPGRHTLSGTLTRSRDRLPEGALRAALAGIEAAVFTWLCMVVPAVASYVATAAAPALGEATWLDAAAAGIGVWRLAHGGALTVDGAVVAFVPLGLGLLAAGILTFSVRRAQVLTWTGAGSAALGYVVVATGLASFAPTAHGGLGATLVGSALVGTTGTLAALLRQQTGPPPLGRRVAQWAQRVPGDVNVVLAAATRAAGVLLVTLLALGTVLVVVSVAASHTTFTGVVTELRTNPFGVVMVLVVSLALLPTAAVWAIAWVSGAGFSLGSGTHVAPDSVVGGPVPALPLLAGVPGPVPIGAWTVVLLVLVGGVGGWYLHRRARLPSLGQAAAAAAAAALLCGAGIALLGSAVSGPVGPGRMAFVGPDPVTLTASATGLVGLGALLVAVGARRESAARATALLGRARLLTAAVPPGLRNRRD
jgi:hypothetical protein